MFKLKNDNVFLMSDKYDKVDIISSKSSTIIDFLCFNGKEFYSVILVGEFLIFACENTLFKFFASNFSLVQTLETQKHDIICLLELDD